jgi:hypothetical protein
LDLGEEVPYRLFCVVRVTRHVVPELQGKERGRRGGRRGVEEGKRIEIEQ